MLWDMNAVCSETMHRAVLSQGTSLGEYMSGVLRRLGLINSGDNWATYTSPPVKRPESGAAASLGPGPRSFLQSDPLGFAPRRRLFKKKKNGTVIRSSFFWPPPERRGVWFAGSMLKFCGKQAPAGSLPPFLQSLCPLQTSVSF